MPEENTGVVTGILGDVVEVLFARDKPGRHELLTLAEDNSVKLEVYGFGLSQTRFLPRQPTGQ